MKKSAIAVTFLALSVIFPIFSFAETPAKKASRNLGEILLEEARARSPASQKQALLEAQHRGQRVELESQGRELERSGLYEEALDKYREALDPKIIDYDNAMSVAKGGISRVYEKQAKYEKALEASQWHLKGNPAKYEHDKRRLEALIKARNTGATEPVYEYIRYMKEEFKRDMPPKSYTWGSGSYTMHIIHLYDAMADYDGGIKFVDGVIKYLKRHHDNAKEYVAVRQGFIEDQKANRSSCLTQPGCKGRATQAMIDAHYWPW